MTDPRRRLTAADALGHPFLQFQPVTFKMFSARRRFKVGKSGWSKLGSCAHVSIEIEAAALQKCSCLE